MLFVAYTHASVGLAYFTYLICYEISNSEQKLLDPDCASWDVLSCHAIETKIQKKHGCDRIL